MTVSESLQEPRPFEQLLPTGMILRGLCWGDDGLPVILALHGWLDNAASFFRLAPLLAERYQVRALEMAGHGQSDHRPEGCRYHLLDNVDDILFYMDAAGLDSVILLGHSMGAAIAGYVAAVNPEVVSRLILLEGLGSKTSSDDEALQVMRDAVRDLKRISQEKRFPLYPDVDAAGKMRAKGIFQMSLPAATALAERGTKPFQSGVTWSSDSRLKMSSAMRLNEAMVTSFLKGISAKSLLLYAENGFLSHGDLLQERARLLEDIDCKQLPGHHHFHMETETVGTVANEINQFLP